jgi:SAM-dependent methyltransferase
MPDHERHNRVYWDADADDYQAAHGAALATAPRAWGVWRIPDDELGVIGDVDCRDVLEYGCGAAQWSIALARRGARAVGLDQSRAQLRHAHDAVAATGADVTLVCASGERTPFRDESFDVVFCDHGVMSFGDPDRTVPELSRLLREGGRAAFCHTAPLVYLTYDRRRERQTRRLQEPYFGMRSFGYDEGTFDFQLPYGEWIRRFRAVGLTSSPAASRVAGPPSRSGSSRSAEPRGQQRVPGRGSTRATR